MALGPPVTPPELTHPYSMLLSHIVRRSDPNLSTLGPSLAASLRAFLLSASTSLDFNLGEELSAFLRTVRSETTFSETFKAFCLHETITILTIRNWLHAHMVSSLRGWAKGLRVDYLREVLGDDRRQTGLDMLIYAINDNTNPYFTNLTIDLSGCNLPEETGCSGVYLESLSYINKHISSLKLGGNDFGAKGISFLFKNLWKDGSGPTFDTIDCQSNSKNITVTDILVATRQHPEFIYVLHTVKKGESLSPDTPQYRGAFIITGAKTATYYIQNGVIISLDGSPPPKNPDLASPVVPSQNAVAFSAPRGSGGGGAASSYGSFSSGAPPSRHVGSFDAIHREDISSLLGEGEKKARGCCGIM